MSFREASKRGWLARRIVPGILAMGLAAASAGALASHDEPGDPLEPANRVSHRIGLFLDRTVLGPAARLYVRVTPGFVRTGVTNFIDNLTYPNVILNDFLQGKVDQGLQDSMRFVVNTTFGLAGFIDVATGFGLEKHEEDLGQTLAVWGVGEIAYLELPGLGPSSVRDVTNLSARVADEPHRARGRLRSRHSGRGPRPRQHPGQRERDDRLPGAGRARQLRVHPGGLSPAAPPPHHGRRSAGGG